MKKLNIGNVTTTFNPEFINRVLEIGKTISKLDEPTAAEVLEIKAEHETLKQEIKKVLKFLNQDTVVLTGALIAAKKREAYDQDQLSIFDFLGMKPEEKKEAKEALGSFEFEE